MRRSLPITMYYIHSPTSVASCIPEAPAEVKFVQVGTEYTYVQIYWAHGGTDGSGTSLQAGRSRVRSPVALGSTKPRTNEYQEYFQACKGGRCVRLINVPPHVLTLEIWEPSAS